MTNCPRCNKYMIQFVVMEPYHNNACQPGAVTEVEGTRSRTVRSDVFPFFPYHIEHVGRCIEELNSKINGHCTCLLDLVTLTSCSSMK